MRSCIHIILMLIVLGNMCVHDRSAFAGELTVSAHKAGDLASATLSTWVVPKGLSRADTEIETPEQAIAGDLRRFMRVLNENSDRYEKPYFNGNDVFFNGFFDSLDILPVLENGVHIGFGGLNNLTLIAHRKSQYACIFDINPAMITMYQCLEEAMRGPEIAAATSLPAKRRAFIDAFIDRLYKEKFLYRDGEGNVMHQERNLRGQLYNPKNWLGSDDLFKYIETMIIEERLSYACLEMLNYPAFIALARKIKALGVTVDTIYISNIFEWISGKYPERYEVRSPYSNQVKFITSLSAIAGPQSCYIIESEFKSTAICAIDEVAKFRKTAYIARVQQDPVRVRGSLRYYKRKGTAQARALLKEYAAAEDKRRTVVARKQLSRGAALTAKGMTLGKRLKLLREAKGWSIPELAKRSGVSFQTIDAYENHEDQFQGPDHIFREPGVVYKLAMALGAEPLVLYMGHPLRKVIVQKRMTIGQRIQFLLLHRGLSREELCQRSGVSLSALQRVEHDRSEKKDFRKYDIPGKGIEGKMAKTIYKIAQALDSESFHVDASVLYEGYVLEKVLVGKRNKMEYGDRIRYIRMVRGLNVEELAEKIISMQYAGPLSATRSKTLKQIIKNRILSYENGKLTSPPDEQKLKGVADALGEEAAVLYTGLPLKKALVQEEMTIGKRIALLRKERGWSQERCAQECDCSRRTISNYERDEPLQYAKGYAPEIIRMIARGLGVSPSLIYTGREGNGEHTTAEKYFISA
ncbi:MAG: helix-turn-helix domain-containing protein [Candidatus Omnitrophica bacterium]|nr:helix-turn-helix domain-containing protein [Candidatus Omnitrophota bacterium]